MDGTRKVLNIELIDAQETVEASTCENNSFWNECEKLKCKLLLLEEKCREKDEVIAALKFSLNSYKNINELIALQSQTNKEKFRCYETRIENQDDKIDHLKLDLKLHAEKLNELNEFLKEYKCKIDLDENFKKDTQKDIIKMNKATFSETSKTTLEQNDQLKKYTNTIDELQDKTKAKLDETKLAENDNQLADKTATCIPFGCQSENTDSKIIYVPGRNSFSVFLENRIAGTGWILVQRSFHDYYICYLSSIYANFSFERKFGEPNTSFWLGLENLHSITIQQQHELYIHLIGTNDEIRYARYDHFVIGSKEEEFQLKSLGKYTGNAGDAMRSQEGHKFSLVKDNNKMPTAGWFETRTTLDCYLHGYYYQGHAGTKGLCWRDLVSGRMQPLKSVQMLIRPK